MSPDLTPITLAVVGHITSPLDNLYSITLNFRSRRERDRALTLIEQLKEEPSQQEQEQ